MRIEQLDSLYEAAVKRGDAEAAKAIAARRDALLARDREKVMARLAAHRWIVPEHIYQIIGKD